MSAICLFAEKEVDLTKVVQWFTPRLLRRGALLLVVSMCFASGLRGQQDAAGAQVGQWLRDGAEAVHLGKFSDAEGYFSKVIAVAPQLPDGYLGMGMARLREGNPDGAEEALKQAASLDPKMPGVHMFLGIAQYQTNELNDAVASLQQEAALDPNNAEALTWLGIVELAAGHPDQATEPLDRASNLRPRDENILDYRARAHTLVAQECFKQLYALDPGSWHVHRALAETFAAARQPEKAIEEYKAALKEQPDNPDLYDALGEQCQQAGNSAAAEAAYQEELKLNSNSSSALFNLGKLHVQNDDAAKGIPLLQQALAAHAAPAPANYYLGLGLDKSGEEKEAAEHLEQCLASNPSDFVRQGALFALVRVYGKLHRTADAQHALEQLRRLKAQAAGRPGHE